MPLNRYARPLFPTHPVPRRARPPHPTCRGGASSLLRLAQPAAQRLPTALDLSGWAGMLMPVTGPLGEFRSNAHATGA